MVRDDLPPKRMVDQANPAGGDPATGAETGAETGGEEMEQFARGLILKEEVLERVVSWIGLTMLCWPFITIEGNFL